jgi:hypothetical protein
MIVKIVDRSYNVYSNPITCYIEVEDFLLFLDDVIAKADLIGLKHKANLGYFEVFGLDGSICFSSVEIETVNINEILNNL